MRHARLPTCEIPLLRANATSLRAIAARANLKIVASRGGVMTGLIGRRELLPGASGFAPVSEQGAPAGSPADMPLKIHCVGVGMRSFMAVRCRNARQSEGKMGKEWGRKKAVLYFEIRRTRLRRTERGDRGNRAFGTHRRWRVLGDQPDGACSVPSVFVVSGKWQPAIECEHCDIS